MFVELKELLLNIDQIMSIEPSGKSFRVNMPDGSFYMLGEAEHLILIGFLAKKYGPIAADKVKPKKSRKLVKEIVAEEPIPKPSTAVFEKAVLKRAVVKQAKTKTLNIEEGKGTSGGGPKPKTKLIKNPLNERKRP